MEPGSSTPVPRFRRRRPPSPSSSLAAADTPTPSSPRSPVDVEQAFFRTPPAYGFYEAFLGLEVVLAPDRWERHVYWRSQVRPRLAPAPPLRAADIAAAVAAANLAAVGEEADAAADTPTPSSPRSSVDVEQAAPSMADFLFMPPLSRFNEVFVGLRVAIAPEGRRGRLARWISQVRRLAPAPPLHDADLAEAVPAPPLRAVDIAANLAAAVVAANLAAVGEEAAAAADTSTPSSPRSPVDVEQAAPSMANLLGMPPVHDAFPVNKYRPVAAFVGLAVVYAPDRWKPPARWSLICTDPGPDFSLQEFYGDPFQPRQHVPVPVSWYEEHCKEQERKLTESPLLMFQLDNILTEFHKGDNHLNWRVPHYIILAFVEALEGARQYIQLKQSIRNNKELETLPDEHTEADLKATVLLLKDKFEKVDSAAIVHALKDFKTRIKYQHANNEKISYLKFLINTDTIKWETTFSAKDCNLSENFPELEQGVLENGFQWYKSCVILNGHNIKELKESCVAHIKGIEKEHLRRLQKAEEHDNLFSERSVFRLVHEQQKYGYVLNQDPEVEILSRLLDDEWFLHHFMKDGPMVNLLSKARTLTITNISFDASEEDVKELVACEGIERIVMSSDPFSQTASVIFENIQGIEAALLLQDPNPRAFLDQYVWIEPCFGPALRRAVARCKAGRRMASFREKATLEEALRKYESLRVFQPVEGLESS